MKNVQEKKYLGDLVSSDLKNIKNIQERVGKGIGNVNKIISTLVERPFGKHNFSAAKLMREGLLINSLLTNSESWINISEKDIENLEKCDIIILRKLLSDYGNPSKVFMYLELGIIPVRFVLMSKRINFLKYILNEHRGSMIREVYEALKTDS